MAVKILMPALSPTMTDGTLARWLVGEGDKVRSGDVIAEIETDKATMEVEALDDGVIAKIVVAEGSQNVAVNALIAVLAEEGEDASEAAKIAKGAEAAPAAVAPAKAATATHAPAPAAAPKAEAEQVAAPSRPPLRPHRLLRPLGGIRGQGTGFTQPLARRMPGMQVWISRLSRGRVRMAGSSALMWKTPWPKA